MPLYPQYRDGAVSFWMPCSKMIFYRFKVVLKIKRIYLSSFLFYFATIFLSLFHHSLSCHSIVCFNSCIIRNRMNEETEAVGSDSMRNARYFINKDVWNRRLRHENWRSRFWQNCQAEPWTQLQISDYKRNLDNETTHLLNFQKVGNRSKKKEPT